MAKGAWMTRRTSKGKTLTETDIQTLADEAEVGYDVAKLKHMRWRDVRAKRSKSIPDFEARVAEMTRAIDEAAGDDDDEGEYFEVAPPVNPSQVYSIRIPVERLKQLRQRAEAESTTPSALMRSWIIERLERETFTVTVLAQPANVDEIGRALQATDRNSRIRGVRTRQTRLSAV